MEMLVGLLGSKLIPTLIAAGGALFALLAAFLRGRKSGLKTAQKRNRKVQERHRKVSRQIERDSADLADDELDGELSKWTR